MQMTCGRPKMNALAAIVFALRGLDPAQFGPFRAAQSPPDVFKPALATSPYSKPYP
jgi:hypothetical protein